ncbi:MAG: hypothetical protein DRH43_10675 [Deltaproteobacteria bacterium]|nr:MAG: hypothetical protein DRH43_10675 [Deltaproteobacteria bacterium]
MNYMQIRETHYVRFFGPMTRPVMHSTDSKQPHIDIYQFEPTDTRLHWTLITGGMSDLRQHIPEELVGRIAPRAEILIYVEEPKPWMFNVLKGLAGMPFDEKTFLHWWHTVPNGGPMTAEPSELTNFFFLPPYFEGVEFNTLHLGDERVDFLWMVPITNEELEYKLKYGAEALETLFEEANLSPVIDEKRTSLVSKHAKPKKWWQIWKS